MYTTDSTEILSILKSCVIDPATLKVNQPIANFNGHPYLIPGTLSLLTATHNAAKNDFIARLAQAVTTGEADELKSRKARMLFFDALSTSTELAMLKEEIELRAGSPFPANISLLSAADRDYQCALDLVEATAKEINPEIIVINDISRLVKNESYREVQRVLLRLKRIADVHSAHILVIGSAGLKISIKRPNRLASLYLLHCSAVMSLTHNTKESTVDMDLHIVGKMLSVPTVTLPLSSPNDPPEKIEATEKIEKSEEIEKSEKIEKSEEIEEIEEFEKIGSPVVIDSPLPRRLSKKEARKMRRHLRRSKKLA